MIWLVGNLTKLPVCYFSFAMTTSSIELLKGHKYVPDEVIVTISLCFLSYTNVQFHQNRC